MSRHSDEGMSEADDDYVLCSVCCLPNKYAILTG